MSRERAAVVALTAVTIAIVLGGVIVQMRSVWCRHGVDSKGVTHVGCSIVWRFP